MRNITVTGAAVAALVIAAMGAHAATKPATPAKATRQVVTGPIATYWMDTTTASGMTLSGMGAKPSMGSIMKMMGGGSSVSHTMSLKLGSSQAASGDAAGDHMPPQALNAGKDLPLYWKEVKTTYEPTTESDQPTEQHYDPPKGKILIFWGCGEHAPKNQPVVIDLSKLTDPNARMQMMKQMVPAGISLDAVRPPSPQTSKSYGEWPNSKQNGNKSLDGNSSLVGAHLIKANYSPDINFTLDASQDFMPPIEVTGNTKDAAGAVPLAWTAMPRSKGFIVTAVGGAQDVVVMWTSAQQQTAWMGFSPQYLTAHDVDTLTAHKALLPGDATTCTVPAEVTGAAQGLLYGITAYGGDTSIAYPPRPSDPNTPWNIQWETKVRYRSAAGGMLGQSMGGMMGMGSRDDTGGDTSATPVSNTSNGQDAGNGKKKKGSLFGDMVKQGLKNAAGGLIP